VTVGLQVGTALAGADTDKSDVKVNAVVSRMRVKRDGVNLLINFTLQTSRLFLAFSS